MKIVLLICIISMIVIGIGYSLLDTVFSLGIIAPSNDIRIALLITEYALTTILLGLLLLKVFIKRKK